MAHKANSTPRAMPGDLCYGLKAIADHLGVAKDQAKYMHQRGKIPTFTMDDGRTVCALRSRLTAWLEDAAGRSEKGEG